MLIAITGKAGAGKDTVCDYLSRNHGFVKTSFAARLKEVAKIKFGLTDDDVNTQEGKKRHIERWGKTVRQLLQLEGTEGSQPLYGQDFWMKHWQEGVDKLCAEGHTNITVSDCRFDHEAEYLASAGAIIVEVARDDSQGNLAGDEKQHISERGVDAKYVQCRILNNGSLEDLWATLDSFVAEHEVRHGT